MTNYKLYRFKHRTTGITVLFGRHPRAGLFLEAYARDVEPPLSPYDVRHGLTHRELERSLSLHFSRPWRPEVHEAVDALAEE